MQGGPHGEAQKGPTPTAGRHGDVRSRRLQSATDAGTQSARASGQLRAHESAGAGRVPGRGSVEAGRHQRPHLRDPRHRRRQRDEHVLRRRAQSGAAAAESFRARAAPVRPREDHDHRLSHPAPLRAKPAALREGERAHRGADPRQRDHRLRVVREPFRDRAPKRAACRLAALQGKVVAARGSRASLKAKRRSQRMRRSCRTVLVSLLTLLCAGICAGSAVAQAKPDLTIALSSFSTETLDPVLGGHLVKYYLSMMFDYLVGTTLDGQPSRDGGIATRWESSPDYKRWTFYLRKGVKFHNGDEATSEDVKFSIMRNIGPRSTTGYAGPLRTLIQTIETPAPDRVVIVTKDPTLIIPTYLSRSLSTEGMVLPPKYKTMIFKLVPEETTRLALLRRGDVDMTEVSRERVKELEKESFPVHFRREESILTLWWILGPDGWVAPMKDKRVREAMNLAIDRAEVAQSIFAGKADPAAIPLGLSWSFKEIGLKVTPEMYYPYDPVRAKKLLAEAGVGGGFPLEVFAYQLPGLPEGKAMAEAVSGYWEKIGIKVKLVPVD